MTYLVMRRPHLAEAPKVTPLPSGYELRLFDSQDDLEPLAFTLSAAFDEPWDVDRVRRELTEAPDVQAVFVVTWQGLPVATASSRWLPEQYPESGYVHWVGTHPDHTRRGLAATLMAQLLQDFLDRGRKDAVVETEDFRIPAITTYLKFGFIPVYSVNDENHQDRWSAIFQRMFNE